ncbi:MAG: lytic transglycosylase domain-containing protein [Bdellovibrionales bacterium]
MLRLTLFFLSFLFSVAPSYAAGNNDAYYKHALAAIDANKPDLAETLAARGSDPILNKVLRGYAMALPRNNYTFNQLSSFIASNPNWPGLKGIQISAEQKIPDEVSPSQIIAWFSQRPPVTLSGFYRYVDALDQSGFADNAQKAVRARWIEGDFTSSEQTAFYARFGSILSEADTWARVDRLLWKNEKNLARRLFPYLNEPHKTLAEVRLDLAGRRYLSQEALSRVPSDAENDPGLMYQQLRLYVKNDENDDAYEILLNAPVDLGNPEMWWEQRHIMVRRAIEDRDYSLAYRLASRHGQTNPSTLVQAEFLGGWLALRFLDKPSDALRHFQNLYDHASTPISRARGSYWMGRAYEALNQRTEAEQAYSNAAAFSTTYYGQLAIIRLQAEPVLVARADPPPPEVFRSSFFAQDYVRAIERLASIGAERRAASFFRAALENTSKREDFILLTEVAFRIFRPDLSIQAVKAANQKNILVQNGGFPLITMQVPSPPEPALTHALIRQESMFNPDAESAAGACGLMQLMPRTAKEISRKIGVRFKEWHLKDPSYNLQLGTAFATRQIGRFDGSYVLALAGYNAGPARVREWIEQFGDPRSEETDPIDWIELIPIQETRNYVQRIIESLQVYRSKLAGGRSPLLIINDLKR